MEIYFDKDIDLFKNKTIVYIMKCIPKYKQYFKPIFEEFIKEIGFEEKFINSIHIIHNKSSYGTTKHIIKDDNILFNIELCDKIIPFISKTQNSLDTFKAKTIFQHEIFHCVETKFLYDSKVLLTPNPLENDFKINTTYNFIYEQSIIMWSEFYAYYNNYKINQWHEIPNISIDIKKINGWFNSLRYIFKEYTDRERLRFPDKFFYDLREFWYHMMSMCAIYMNNHEILLIEDYINSEYKYIQIYFKEVFGYLKNLILDYPLWLNTDNYIKFGYKLMTIFELNDIVLQNDDLNDNFFFKLKN